ncbi:MAG: ABC transporter ATP-binding protein [Clostridia bacterium]|nr:ABC transporter ATP-binding protein [Clostridia bacterium]
MFSCLKKYKKELFFGPFVKLIEAIIEVALPFIIAGMINKIEVLTQGEIVKYALIMFALIVIGYICAVCAQYIAAKTSQGFGTEYRNKVYEHILKLKNKDIDKYGSSAMVNRITTDINNLEIAVAMFIRLVIRVPFIFIGSLVMVAILNINIAEILIGVVCILAFAIFIIVKIASNYQKKSNIALDKISKKIKESLMNIKVIRSFCNEDIEYKNFNKINEEKYRYDKKANAFSNLLNPVSIVILDLTIAVILYYTGIWTISIGISKGDLIAIINYISQMILAIVILSNLVAIYTKAFVSAKRVREILDIKVDESSNQDNFKDNPKESNTRDIFNDTKNHQGKSYPIDDDVAIKFNNVCFGYDAKNVFCNDINFEIKKGETIGIIGLTGSGKSTILQLINKSYNPTSGDIFINGTNIKYSSQKSIKNQVVLVEQKANFYTQSIADNVKMGRKAPIAEVINALKISGAYEFVEKLEEGINTKIENNGNNFSGGQKQRISLARGFIGNAQILLLDDTTNALDNETEQDVLSNIWKYVKSNNITLIIAAQKISTISNCDRIILMNNGNVQCIGNHEELMMKSNLYRKIDEVQNTTK